MREQGKRWLGIGVTILGAFAIWTVLLQIVDVQQIGPMGSVVGFATLNGWAHEQIGVHEKLYVVTDWLGIVPVFVCLLFGITDMLTFLPVVLPIYPNTVNGYVYAVNLFAYTETTALNQTIYRLLFLALILMGAAKLLLTQLRLERRQRLVTCCSMGLSGLAVLVLALAGEPYAVTMVFTLLMIKGILLYQSVKSGSRSEGKGE